MRVAILLLVGLATVVLSTHITWVDRHDFSTDEHCTRFPGSGNWLSRDGITRCGTCNSRCYHAKFKASPETNGSPVGLCDTTDDICDIDVYVRTAPCCRCQYGHEEATVLEEDNEESLLITTTESDCEVPSMLVTVNGYWTLPLDACNTTANALFEQQWIGGDATSNSIRDCPPSTTSGARIRQAYKKAYRNGRFPDPCFSDDYLVESYVTEKMGTIVTDFKMWRPNSNAVWFDTMLTRHQALAPIECKEVPKVVSTYADLSL